VLLETVHVCSLSPPGHKPDLQQADIDAGGAGQLRRCCGAGAVPRQDRSDARPLKHGHKGVYAAKLKSLGRPVLFNNAPDVRHLEPILLH
jgi:hypothetical protein